MPLCPSCEEKIIINGGIAASVLTETCKSIYEFVEKGGTFPDALKLVKMANEIEDKAFAFTKEVLKQRGFTGPWPKSMAD